jgi:SAM-dependent methyltransferase
MTKLNHRIVEPELMDEASQAQAYAEADFAAPHESWVDQFVASWPAQKGPLKGIALDIGCGPADVVVRLAHRCPALVIDGIDGAFTMLRLGQARVRAHGLHNRVRLYHAVLPGAALPRWSYDVILSNSILHHLHDPQVLWRTIRKAAAKQAHVFVMDLLRPATLAAAADLVDRYAHGEPEVLRRDFHASLCAAFSVEEVKEQLVFAGLAGLQVRQVSDRHLIVTGTLP